MLRKLYIQNVAVIRQAEIDFEVGFNVFTGETGAGKTVLISAIDAVLGERTARDIIRTGEERAVVSALFEDVSPAVLAALEELGYQDEDGSVLIQRELTASGKSGGRICGVPATASVLKQLAPMLVHIHGQRDAQQLLLPERHIEMIDAFGDYDGEKEEYGEAFKSMRELERELAALDMDEQEKSRRVDMLEYQIAEIEAATLSDPDEEDELLARKKMLVASERILESLAEAYDALSGDDERDGINSLFNELCEGVDNAAKYIESLEPASTRLEDMRYELIDLAAEIRAQLDDFELDPRELDNIEYRLNEIYKLKRKYGGDIAAILEFYDGARQELESVTTSERRAAELKTAFTAAQERAEALAGALSQLRVNAAEEFIRRVEQELAFLEMPSVRLSARRSEKPLSHDGWDEISFYVATNVGEEPKPLSKIASGGEISRMMLAMKNVLAGRDEVGALIFDEVDTGVSGRTAQKIGAKLSQVSRGRQVICVTHLAQVAAYADTHFLISKEVEQGRTFTLVKELDEDAHARELARIISGDSVTDAALENARELISRASAEKSGVLLEENGKGAPQP